MSAPPPTPPLPSFLASSGGPPKIAPPTPPLPAHLAPPKISPNPPSVAPPLPPSGPPKTPLPPLPPSLPSSQPRTPLPAPSSAIPSTPSSDFSSQLPTEQSIPLTPKRNDSFQTHSSFNQPVAATYVPPQAYPTPEGVHHAPTPMSSAPLKPHNAGSTTEMNGRFKFTSNLPDIAPDYFCNVYKRCPKDGSKNLIPQWEKSYVPITSQTQQPSSPAPQHHHYQSLSSSNVPAVPSSPISTNSSFSQPKPISSTPSLPPQPVPSPSLSSPPPHVQPKAIPPTPPHAQPKAVPPTPPIPSHPSPPNVNSSSKAPPPPIPAKPVIPPKPKLTPGKLSEEKAPTAFPPPIPAQTLSSADPQPLLDQGLARIAQKMTESVNAKNYAATPALNKQKKKLEELKGQWHATADLTAKQQIYDEISSIVAALNS